VVVKIILKMQRRMFNQKISFKVTKGSLSATGNFHLAVVLHLEPIFFLLFFNEKSKLQKELSWDA
jgi:hypothetical protein